MKISKIILTVLLSSVFLYSCGSEDNNTNESETITKEQNGVFLQEINNEPLVQYTPNLSPWNQFANAPLEKLPKYNPNGYESHAPKDFTLMTEQDWKNNYWDGTPINPEKLTREELHKKMFPRHGVILGLKQLYEKHKPFKDEKNPTKAEVDEWNRLIVNHFRALCGYGAEKYKVKNEHMLYIKTLWSDEVKFTSKWDNFLTVNNKKVIDEKNESGNPGDKNYYLNRGHFGWTFMPPAEYQKPYYPSPSFTPCCKSSNPEGVGGVRKWQPWSIKLSIVLSGMIKSEGFWGGHLGPLWHREKIGISYYKSISTSTIDGQPDDRWVQVRLLYDGELREPLYKDPDGSGDVY